MTWRYCSIFLSVFFGLGFTYALRPFFRERMYWESDVRFSQLVRIGVCVSRLLLVCYFCLASLGLASFLPVFPGDAFGDDLLVRLRNHWFLGIGACRR